MLKIFSKDACPACRMSKKWLVENGIEFEEILVDVRNDTETLEKLRSLGFMAFPVIVPNGDDFVKAWSGYRLDKLRALK